MRRFTPIVVAVVSCGISFGCNSSDESRSATSGGAYAALANQLQNCGSAALDCLKTASCDAAKERTCREDFDACRDDNGAVLKEALQSIQDCCDTRKECVAAARMDGTAGSGAWKHVGHHMPRAHEACGNDFAMCIGGTELSPPPAGPCMQDFHDCIEAGEGPHGCVSAARTCFLNHLPMCHQG